jgi:DHA2 family multidrug resistance protein
MGALSVPNSTASLRGIPNALIPRATGIYNLTRQLGAAFGIAMLTTLLDTRADVHRSALAPHLSPLEPSATGALARVTENLTRSGLDPDTAQLAATAVLGHQLERVAMSLAFRDIYGYLGLAFVACLPLAFLIVKHAPGKHVPIPDSDPVPHTAPGAAH